MSKAMKLMNEIAFQELGPPKIHRQRHTHNFSLNYRNSATFKRCSCSAIKSPTGKIFHTNTTKEKQ